MSLAIVPSAQLGIDFGYNSSQTQANINWNDVLFGVTVPFNLTRPSISMRLPMVAGAELTS